jgi:hypothetical protein
LKARCWVVGVQPDVGIARVRTKFEPEGVPDTDVDGVGDAEVGVDVGGIPGTSDAAHVCPFATFTVVLRLAIWSPMTPPITPAMIAMTIPRRIRTGQRVRLGCRR